MGTEERQLHPDLNAALARVTDEARRFSFFRLVYLLERMFPSAPEVGQLGPVSDERIRLRGDPSLSFPSSDVTDARPVRYADETDRVRVSTTFLGLYGAVSPLPAHYAEHIAESDYQGGPQPVREFLDVLHHRLLSLVYRAWTKYRFAVAVKTGGTDPFSRRMMCCVGLDGFHDHRTPIQRFLHLRYASLLATRSRSARGLLVVLEDLFGDLGVRIEQFVGHWTRIVPEDRNRLGLMNQELGVNFTLGRYVFDGTARFTIVFGPLGYDQYLSLLPGGHRRPLLRGIVDTFAPGIHDVMLELHVEPDAAPRFQLGSPRAATLQRTAWLGGAKGQAFVLSVPLDEPHDAGAHGSGDPAERPPG